MRQNNDSRIIITIKLEMQPPLPPRCKRNSWLFLLRLTKILNCTPDNISPGKNSMDEQIEVTMSLRKKGGCEIVVAILIQIYIWLIAVTCRL